MKHWDFTLGYIMITKHDFQGAKAIHCRVLRPLFYSCQESSFPCEPRISLFSLGIFVNQTKHKS